MDIKIKGNFTQDEMAWRIQTRRRKIRRIKAGREKDLLALDRRHTQLWKSRRVKEYVDVIPPYQRGWRRSYELRADTASGKETDFFTEILKIINTVQFSHLKDFKKKGRKAGKKVYNHRWQSLATLESWEWNKLATNYQRAFNEVWTAGRKSPPRKLYVFAEPWRFVLKVRPNIITQAVKVNPVLESNYRKMENMLDRRFLRPSIDKLTRGNVYKYWKGESRYGRRCRTKKTTTQYLKMVHDEHENIVMRRSLA